MTVPDLGSGVVDVIARTAIVYVAIVVILRVAGKREVAQLSMLDFVTILLIANAVQNAMVGANSSVIGGVVAAGVLIALDRGIGALRDRSLRVQHVIEGEPRLLVRDGVVLKQAMHQEGVTEDELWLALRQHGITRLESVRLAVLETNGAISVLTEPGDAGLSEEVRADIQARAGGGPREASGL